MIEKQGAYLFYSKYDYVFFFVFFTETKNDDFIKEGCAQPSKTDLQKTYMPEKNIGAEP